MLARVTRPFSRWRGVTGRLRKWAGPKLPTYITCAMCIYVKFNMQNCQANAFSAVICSNVGLIASDDKLYD
jgi:hypothetical protein